MTPLEVLDISQREAMSESSAVRRAAERIWGIVTPLTEQEAEVLTEGGLDPHKSLTAFASAYFEDDARQTLALDSLYASAPSAPQASVNDPNIWAEDKVREYLGFAPYPADDGFWEFAEALLEEVFPSDDDDNLRYYFAEQFACGSVIPGVKALWYQWPSCVWREFADWLAGSAPGMGSSRRDFLMAGGDFMRVWRDVSAFHEDWPDGWPDSE